jgi:hypothetical protein
LVKSRFHEQAASQGSGDQQNDQNGKDICIHDIFRLSKKTWRRGKEKTAATPGALRRYWTEVGNFVDVGQ